MPGAFDDTAAKKLSRYDDRREVYTEKFSEPTTKYYDDVPPPRREERERSRSRDRTSKQYYSESNSSKRYEPAAPQRGYDDYYKYEERTKTQYAAPPEVSQPRPPRSPQPVAVPSNPTAGGNPKYWESDSDSDSDSDESDGPTGDRKLEIEISTGSKSKTQVRKRQKAKITDESAAVALVTTTTNNRQTHYDVGPSRYAEPKRYEYAPPPTDIRYSAKPVVAYTSTNSSSRYEERPRYETRTSSTNVTKTTTLDPSTGKSTEVVTVEPGRRNRTSQGASLGASLAVGGLGVAAGASLAAAPGSPMLEAYRGTYQTIGSMPSPLMLASRPSNTDIAVLDLGRAPSPRRKSARFHDLAADASLLKIALRDTGSKAYPDPEPFIRILPALSHEQIMELRDEYKKQVKTPDMKGVNVAKHIKLRLKEDKNFLKCCYTTALGRWESEGYWANSYYQGDKAARELLIESLMGRSNAEIRQIKQVFKDKKYSDDLVKCMGRELKEDKFKMAVMLVLEEAKMEEPTRRDPLRRDLIEKDVRDLYRAIRSERGGETTMIQICVLRSEAHMKEVLRLYESTYRANFAREMLKKSGNLVGELLAHILNGIINRPVRDALLLSHALNLPKSDPSRNDLLISRLVRLHWDPNAMEAVRREFRGRYGVDLIDAVAKGTSGYWGAFCEELCVRRVPDDVRRVERYEGRGGERVERYEKVSRVEVRR